MVKSIRAPELKDASPAPALSERPNAGERGLTGPLRAVKELAAGFGYSPGTSHREKDSDYSRVLAVDIGDGERLIVCKDEIQVIHQRYIGGEWRHQSFHCTLNCRLLAILKHVRSGPRDASSVLDPTKQPKADQRGVIEPLSIQDEPIPNRTGTEASEVLRDD